MAIVLLNMKKIVRIVDLFRCIRNRKWFNFCYSKITLFSKVIACFISKQTFYPSLAKSVTLYIVFHTFTIKHLSWYG